VLRHVCASAVGTTEVSQRGVRIGKLALPSGRSRGTDVGLLFRGADELRRCTCWTLNGPGDGEGASGGPACARVAATVAIAQGYPSDMPTPGLCELQTLLNAEACGCTALATIRGLGGGGNRRPAEAGRMAEGCAGSAASVGGIHDAGTGCATTPG